ncbi:retrovirus-related pol polyprotein from transposon TNT 1-94 [Tanacetum coccineum]
MASSVHQETHKIVKDDIFPIVNQVDARVQNFKIQFLKEAAKFVRDFKSLAKEADESLAKHKALELEIERLLRAIVSQDIMSIMQNPSVIDTSNLQTELKRKPPSSYGSKLYAVTPFPKSKGLPKIDESHALSKPVTSNSIPTQQESKVVKNEKVIAPRMFRIDPRTTSKEDKFVPINKVRASVRTYPITVSQPHVITKKDVRSNSNGLSSTGIESNAKTRRSQPRINIKNDRVPSASKSSCIKNKEVEVEEYHRNLMFSKNKIHMSSECNNIKLAIRNDKSEVVYAMYKQCLITANHDVCVLNYVNGMNSHGKKQKANVSKIANQKKHKPRVKKPKKVGSTERLASPKPSKPRSCLRWSPTGRIFNLKRKIIASSESESQSDCSKGHSNLFMFLGTIRFGNDHVAAILGKEKSKKASHPPKLVPNSKQRSKYEASEVIKTFLKKIQVLLQAPIIIIRTDNGTKFKNQVLKEYFDSVGICHQAYFDLCYPKNDRENIGKLGAKGDIGFFIGYSTNSCAYKVYNRRTKKIIETMNVTFDELLAMAFEQSSSKPGLQSMTYGQISLGLDLTYAPSTITSQKPTERELDLLPSSWI